MEPCTRDIPCAMMTINNATNYVTWLVCNLQTRDRLLNMSSKMGTIWQLRLSRRNTFKSFKVSSSLQTEKLSCCKMPKHWPVKSDDNSKWVLGLWAEAKGVCGFDLKILKKLCSLEWFQSYKKMFLHGEDVHPHLVCPKD